VRPVSGEYPLNLPEAISDAGGHSGVSAPEHLSGPAAFTAALRRDYFGYLLSLGTLSLGNLLLLPIITAHLPANDIGLYSLVEGGIIQGSTLGLLGMKFAYLYHYAQQPADRSRLLGNALLLAVASGLCTGLFLTLIFSNPAFMALFDSKPLPMAWLLIPLLLTGVVQAMMLTELRAARRVWLTGAITSAQLALLLGLSLWLVAFEQGGLPGLLAAQATAQGLSCLCAVSLVRRRLTLTVHRGDMTKLMRYGLPLMLGLMLRYGLDTLSRFAIAAMISIEAAGLFLIVSRVALLFEGLLSLPFFMAWGGLVHHALRRPEARLIVSRISSIAIAAAAVLALLAIAAQPQLFGLLAHGPMPAVAATFALLLTSRAVTAARSPLTAGILRSGRTGWSVTSSLLALAVFLSAIGPGIALAGLTGAAAALLLADLAAALWLGRLAWRECPQQIAPSAIGLAILLAVAVGTTIGFGAPPLWLRAGLVALAGLLIARMMRHDTVADRL
jgi:O-antigen/teichoic acid export membrane protein